MSEKSGQNVRQKVCEESKDASCSCTLNPPHSLASQQTVCWIWLQTENKARWCLLIRRESVGLGEVKWTFSSLSDSGFERFWKNLSYSTSWPHRTWSNIADGTVFHMRGKLLRLWQVRARRRPGQEKGLGLFHVASLWKYQPTLKFPGLQSSGVIHPTLYSLCFLMFRNKKKNQNYLINSLIPLSSEAVC